MKFVCKEGPRKKKMSQCKRWILISELPEMEQGKKKLDHTTKMDMMLN